MLPKKLSDNNLMNVANEGTKDYLREVQDAKAKKEEEKKYKLQKGSAESPTNFSDNDFYKEQTKSLENGRALQNQYTSEWAADGAQKKFDSENAKNKQISDFQNTDSASGSSVESARRYARLANALNNRNWVNSSLGSHGDMFSGQGFSSVDKGVYQDKPIETLETRAQERLEGYEQQSVQDMLSRKDLWQRFPQQMEQLRLQDIENFNKGLDEETRRRIMTAQINRIVNEESTYAAQRRAEILAAEEDPIRGYYMGSSFGIPYVSSLALQQAREAERQAQYAMKNYSPNSPEYKKAMEDYEKALIATQRFNVGSQYAQSAAVIDEILKRAPKSIKDFFTKNGYPVN